MEAVDFVTKPEWAVVSTYQHMVNIIKVLFTKNNGRGLEDRE